MVKVGTISRKIEPSEATIDKVFRDASTFEIAVANKDFSDVAKENDYALRPVNSIKILDESIPGLGNQRTMVRWAFEEGANGTVDTVYRKFKRAFNVIEKEFPDAKIPKELADKYIEDETRKVELLEATYE